MKFLAKIAIKNKNTDEQDSYLIPKNYFWDENNAFGELTGRMLGQEWEVNVKLFDGSIHDWEDRMIFENDYEVKDAIVEVLNIMRDLHNAELDFEASEMARELYEYGYQKENPSEVRHD